MTAIFDKNSILAIVIFGIAILPAPLVVYFPIPMLIFALLIQMIILLRLATPHLLSLLFLVTSTFILSEFRIYRGFSLNDAFLVSALLVTIGYTLTTWVYVLRYDGVFWGFALFIGSGLVHPLWHGTIDIEILSDFLRWVVVFQFYIFAVSFRQRPLNINIPKTGIVTGALVTGLFALYEFASRQDIDLTRFEVEIFSIGGVVRSSGLYGVSGSNGLGIYLGFSLPWAFLAFKKSHGWGRMYYGLACVVIPIGLLTSVSRSAFLATTVAMIVYFVLTTERFSLIGLVLMIAAGGLLFAELTGIRETVSSSLINRYQVSFQETDVNFNVRREIDRISINIWRDYPIYGSGLGTFERLVPRYSIYSPIVRSHFISTGTALSSHNAFTLVLAETGSLGIIGLLLIGVGTLYRFYRLFEVEESYSIAVTLLSSLTVLVIAMFANNSLSDRTFWFMLGLVYAFKTHIVKH